MDVLRSVTGLTDADLNATEQITFENGKSYSVPAPDIMLKAKLANLEFHDQKDRQDERHIRILVKCCEHYLRDTATAAISTNATLSSASWQRIARHSKPRRST